MDLMERINFLVSHLVVLERIHNVEAMMDTLTAVLQKVCCISVSVHFRHSLLRVVVVSPMYINIGINEKSPQLLSHHFTLLCCLYHKVQDTLKEAAALIEAYRKQSKIARRLRMSNMQNFEQMAGKITTCSSDLMMSLQIQQTGDLSILKRVVPRDRIAENFIRENGGQDMINVSIRETKRIEGCIEK